MQRWLARSVFVVLLALIASALGTVTAMIRTRPGRALLARFLSQESNRLVRGSLSIGRIDGDFVSGVTLDSVVIRDTTGALLADIEQLDIRYRLSNLLAKRFVFDAVSARGARLEVTKHRGGRMNYQEILKLDEKPPGTGPGTLLRLESLVLVDGQVTIRIPWNPDGRLTTAAQRDSALAAERLRPGRRIDPGALPSDGLMMVRVVDGLNGRFSTMRLSTPDHLPFATVIDSLAAAVTDPGITIRDLKGRMTQAADSLLFQLDRAALPATVVSGAGRLRWPQDTILYQFELAATAVDLADLRWVSPLFPDLAGVGRVKANSLAGSRTEYDITGLDLRGGGSQVRGAMVAILDGYRGLGFRHLGLQLQNLDLETVRPYLDTLPFAGRITGPLRASGFFGRMSVAADWQFADARVDGGAMNRVAFEGDLTFGGPDGMLFHGTRVLRSDFDLRTVRMVTPAVRLDGRLVLDGTLEGPWRNVVFDGRLEHRDDDRPMTALTGRSRLDTRGALLGLDATLTVDTLSFDGIRRSFPTTPMQGALGGTLRLTGFLDSLRVGADLTGAVGRYRVSGETSLLPPRWEARGLVIDFTNANLAALGGRGPVTRLNGRLEMSGRIDSLVAPEADLNLVLLAGRIEELAVDSGRVRLSIHDSLLTVDTAAVRWEGGGFFGRGTLGWLDPHHGRLSVEATALSLAPFDSLLASLASPALGEGAEEALLSGRGRFAATIIGSLDRFDLTGSARVDSVEWLDSRIRLGSGTLTAHGGRLDSLRFATAFTVDTVARGRMVFNDVGVMAEGSPADFQWTLAGGSRGGTRLNASGQWSDPAKGPRVLAVDSLAVTVIGRRWLLERPVAVVLDSVAVTDSLVLATEDGSGSVRLSGNLPGRQPGRAEIQAVGVSLADLYALAQRDTTGIGGLVAIDARISGTQKAPTFRGSATVTGPVIGDAVVPLVRTVFNYEDRVLQANLTFWRTGRPVLDVDAVLPLDLALVTVARRQLPGEIVIRGRADSVDLGVIEAFTPNLRKVLGTVAVDATVGGTWEAPRLGGLLSVHGGGAYVPGLRVTYGPINGRIRMSGDSLIADSIVVQSRIGSARVGGWIQLERLTHPVLGLTLSASDFDLIDVPDYLTLRATGDVALVGPIERPVLTGDARATSSVLYFSDLITKDIVNLEDPANADLVDTTALRAQNIGAQFQSRFLDSLAIRDLRFRVGEDVWLRSNEANIQLEGLVTVNKDRRQSRRSEYRVSGALTTPRGAYTLKLGPVFRTFVVERGTVQYFNTSDLNAQLDLSARYVVRTGSGGGQDDTPVIARISGTLLVPKLNLTNEPGRAPMSERDLLSLLVTGSNANSFLARSGEVFSFNRDLIASIASSVFASEIERALISSPNSAFDLIEIRPGLAQGNSLFASGGSVTQLSLGRQISRRLFATLNLGGCLQRFEFDRQYFGATLEYRLHPTLKFQIAAEPVQSCLAQSGATLSRTNRYQFGADLKWDRDY